MLEERREIIKYALNLNILNINTYSGYKGDLIVKFTTSSDTPDVKDKIRTYAKNIGMDVVVKDNKNVLIYEIYCISEDEDHYGLKID